MMRFAVAGAARSRRRRRAHPRLDRAQHEVRDRPLRALPARPTASSARTGPVIPGRPDRAASRGAGAVMATSRARSSRSGSSPPATAASSACSTSRTSCLALAGADRGRLLPGGDARRRSRAPTTSRWSRARSPPPQDAERIQEVRRQVAAPGDDRRLRDLGRDPGAAELRRRRGLHVGRLRHARVHLDARDLDPDLRPRPRRLRAPGLPDQQAPAARGDQRLPQRAPARDRHPQRLHRVQAPRQRLRDGRPRHAMPRARSPTPAAARSAPATTAAATAASGRWRRPTRPRSPAGSSGLGMDERRPRPRLPHLPHGQAEPFRSESEARSSADG